ncbi:hypothetical protein VNO80_11243 [Phaseolus coccineus]|uniref:Uncharacterized protein n=1 Tax=Phaseolus coccineus TaxID=3886 RepID=A0AAN9NEX1_PHACN
MTTSQEQVDFERVSDLARDLYNRSCRGSLVLFTSFPVERSHLQFLMLSVDSPSLKGKRVELTFVELNDTSFRPSKVWEDHIVVGTGWKTWQRSKSKDVFRGEFRIMVVGWKNRLKLML